SVTPRAGTPGGDRARECRARAALSGPGGSGVHFRIRYRQIVLYRIRPPPTGAKPQITCSDVAVSGQAIAERVEDESGDERRHVTAEPGDLLDQGRRHEPALGAGREEHRLDAGQRRV